MNPRLPVPLFLVILGFSFTVLNAQPSAPPAYHTERFDSLGPSANPGGRYSGLTGYAAPDGREYALLGGFRGTYIIDVTEAPVRLVALVEGPTSEWRELKTFRNYAYVVNESGGGLQIIDLSTLPEPPVLVMHDSSVFHTGHTISQEGDYIYVHGSDLAAGANSGTLIFQVADNPLAPNLVGSFGGHYVHDAVIRNDTLYAAGIYEGKLSIVALGADRKAPTLVTEISYPGGGTHNAALSPDGSYVMTTDEIGTTDKTLKVWDIHDLNNISKVADFTPEPGAIIHNVVVKGRLAFVSWYAAGTRVLDITDPAQPVEVGYFDAYPGTVQAYTGNWDVYPYLPSGKILASYMESGLEVFTFDGALAGHVSGRVRDAVTNQPLPGALIRLSRPDVTIRSDDEGRFRFSGAIGRTGYTAYLQNYRVGQGELDLVADGADSDILLQPLPLNTYTIEVMDSATVAPVDAFVYRVAARENGEGVSHGSTQQFMLPRDSTYVVRVGAWGFQPKFVELREGGDLTIPVRLQRGYSDDAELDLGWTFGLPSDRAIGGIWERGEPLEVKLYRNQDTVVVQPGSDATADPGTRAFITGLSRPGEYSNPVYGGITSLVSPPMDLSGYGDPYINAAIWYSNEAWYVRGAQLPLTDTLELLLSDDDGAQWTMLAKIGRPTKGWAEFHFRIRDAITPTARTRFMIRASDSVAPSVVEAGLDDFRVTEGSDAAAPVTMNHAEGVLVTPIPHPLGRNGHLAVTLRTPQHEARLDLVNLVGERVMLLHAGEMPEGTTLVPLDAAGLPAGRYIWRLWLDNGSAVNGAVVVAP